jgi:hypothetical protein
MPPMPLAEHLLPLSSATVRDLVIGMSDGLTVPFALAAGHLSARRFGGGTRRRSLGCLPRVLTRRPGRAQYGAAGTAGS